jgi:putative Holliday junction resolvase
VRGGVRLGIDIGTVRVGVARCDGAGMLATPLETVRRRPDGGDLSRIAHLAAECDAVEIVIGLPLHLSGQEGTASTSTRKYAEAVAWRVCPVPVRLVDERLTTVTAHRAMREAGVAGRRQRGLVDQAAAVVILQSALDAERASGQPPGSIVVPGTAPEDSGPAEETGEGSPW